MHGAEGIKRSGQGRSGQGEEGIRRRWLVQGIRNARVGARLVWERAPSAGTTRWGRMRMEIGYGRQREKAPAIVHVVVGGLNTLCGSWMNAWSCGRPVRTGRASRDGWAGASRAKSPPAPGLGLGTRRRTRRWVEVERGLERSVRVQGRALRELLNDLGDRVRRGAPAPLLVLCVGEERRRRRRVARAVLGRPGHGAVEREGRLRGRWRGRAGVRLHGKGVAYHGSSWKASRGGMDP